jgi:uncharacterized membrane protein YqjE
VGGETKMKENGRHQVQMPEVAESVSGLTHDVIELGELQAQLLMSELKKSSQKTRTCLILAIVGVCLLLASLPVALFALAEVLVEQLDWSRSAAFGVSALVGLLLSGVLFGWTYAIARRGLFSLQRSRDEFNQNIAWIKSTLRDRGKYRAFAER